ncbi:BICD family-like cargo adapter 1 [Saccoglossus kowalevskii]|uniref:Bicaudal D-related protein 1-like n=1 Tax=Saccoglossus kowalevskii TaxID=10224 RepID=A0ABM0M6U7_SACKO|nr:PREDICTED: bicaudal D-related protein 1-like [Saccoglossus kowalevskii]
MERRRTKMSFSEDDQYGDFDDENDQNTRIDSPTDTSDYNSYPYSMEDEDQGATAIYSENDANVIRRNGHVDEDDDIHAQLAQKEKDLILAAELGKALLESNEELSRKQEHLQRDYTERIEMLEQERYELKLRLESIEGQFDGKVMDMQSEVRTLQEKLTDQQQSLKVAEKEKQDMVRELSEQNQRLSSQLHQASLAEEELTEQMQKLQMKLTDNKSSMSSNTHVLDRLREEIQLLTDRKCELEKRLNAVVEERDALENNLEETNDRVMMLDRQLRETQIQVFNKDSEIDELRTMNSHLQDRVEELSQQTLHQHTDSPSLFDELAQHTDSPSLFEELDDQQFTMDTTDIASMSTHQRYSIDDIESDEEYDDVVMAMSQGPTETPVDFETEQLQAINQEMKLNIEESCQHLREILKDLKQHFVVIICGVEDDTNPSAKRAKTSDKYDNEEEADENETEELRDIIQQIQSIVHQVMQKQLMLSTASSLSGYSMQKTKSDLAELESKIQFLEVNLQSTQDHMEKLKTKINQQNGELQRKTDELEVMSCKARQSVADNCLPQLHDTEREVDVLQRERLLSEQQHQEDIIKREEDVRQARVQRDGAIAKKNAVELQLTRSKIDMMNLDSQLLEAIQQKIELSQQLDQWQVDMESLLGNRMQKKLDEDKSNSTITPGTRRKKLSFWS